LTNLDSEKSLNYNLKKVGNGVYFFLLSGEVVVNGKVLKSRDGLGAWNQDQFVVESNQDAELLVMEVPMTI
jgi:hypothetical protein